MPRPDAHTQMLKACSHGDLSFVIKLMKQYGSQLLDVNTSDGVTPVLLAAKHRHLNIVQYLFSQGVSWHATDTDKRRQGNVLHYACWGGSFDVVKWLLETHQPDLSCTDIVGNTPLLYAVYGGHRTIIELLLEYGCSLIEHNHKHHTAILQAACGGHLDLLRWLLDEKDFSIQERDQDGNTALLFAAWGGHRHVIDFLLARGVSLHERNFNGHCILLSAANGGRVNIVDWLLSEHGFSLHTSNHNGDTPLLLSCYGGHLPLVKRLIQLGASMNDRNSCGFTPLLSAANGAQLSTVKWLVKQGCSVHDRDSDGYSGIILAACGGSIELVKFFLAQGASLQERNNNGDTPLLLAAYCGHVKLLRWLLNNGSRADEKNNTCMGVAISAANGGHVDTVQYLLDELGTCCLYERDLGRYTPFLLASQRGHLHVAQLLAARGCEIHAQTDRGSDALALSVTSPAVHQYIRYIWDMSNIEIACDLRHTDYIHEKLREGLDILREGPCCLEIATRTGPYSNAKPEDVTLTRLLKLALQPWSPATHHLHGPGFRFFAVFMLWVKKELDAKQNVPYLPTEVWFHIMSFVDPTWHVIETYKTQNSYSDQPEERSVTKFKSKRRTVAKASQSEAAIRAHWRSCFLETNNECNSLCSLLSESKGSHMQKSFEDRDHHSTDKLGFSHGKLVTAMNRYQTSGNNSEVDSVHCTASHHRRSASDLTERYSPQSLKTSKSSPCKKSRHPLSQTCPDLRVWQQGHERLSQQLTPLEISHDCIRCQLSLADLSVYSSTSLVEETHMGHDNNGTSILPNYSRQYLSSEYGGFQAKSNNTQQSTLAQSEDPFSSSPSPGYKLPCARCHIASKLLYVQRSSSQDSEADAGSKVFSFARHFSGQACSGEKLNEGSNIDRSVLDVSSPTRSSRALDCPSPVVLDSSLLPMDHRPLGCVALPQYSHIPIVYDDTHAESKNGQNQATPPHVHLKDEFSSLKHSLMNETLCQSSATHPSVTLKYPHMKKAKFGKFHHSHPEMIHTQPCADTSNNQQHQPTPPPDSCFPFTSKEISPHTKSFRVRSPITSISQIRKAKDDFLCHSCFLKDPQDFHSLSSWSAPASMPHSPSHLSGVSGPTLLGAGKWFNDLHATHSLSGQNQISSQVDDHSIASRKLFSSTPLHDILYSIPGTATDRRHLSRESSFASDLSLEDSRDNTQPNACLGRQRTFSTVNQVPESGDIFETASAGKSHVYKRRRRSSHFNQQFFHSQQLRQQHHSHHQQHQQQQQRQQQDQRQYCKTIRISHHNQRNIVPHAKPFTTPTARVSWV